MKFWIWYNARLVVNIEEITHMRVTERDAAEFVYVYLTSGYGVSLTQEEYQNLMNFIIENTK